jgi:hypothetical protein
MADHGTIEYATATGNDYQAHENTYDTFIKFSFAGSIYIINMLLGLAVGGVMGSWFPAFVMIFIIGPAGLVAGLAFGSKTPSYVAFAICLLIFAFTGLTPH